MIRSKTSMAAAKFAMLASWIARTSRSDAPCPPALSALQDTSDILINRVGRDEDHFSRKGPSARQLCLVNRRLRPQRRLDGERVPSVDVALYETLALLRHRATNMPRDGAMAR